jgi:hypothetical protein
MRQRPDDYVPVASAATWAALCAHCERLGFREGAFHGHLGALIDREFERGRQLDDLVLSVLIEMAAAMAADVRPELTGVSLLV